jgi:hypothetical protein
MLAHPAPFPCPGAPAFLKPNADPVRIVQRRTDGRVLVSRDLPKFLRSASTELTVDFDDLAENEKDAIVITKGALTPKPRPRRRARRSS